MTADQLQLFTEREHRSLGAPPVPNENGVYLEPDETLELQGPHRFLPMARIELVNLPVFGWIYATSYTLSDQGAGYRPALKWAKRGDSRGDALAKAKCELLDSMLAYLDRHSDSASAKRQAMTVANWLKGLA